MAGLRAWMTEAGGLGGIALDPEGVTTHDPQNAVVSESIFRDSRDTRGLQKASL